METKIASYQEDGIRLQLLKIQNYSTEMGIYYQIRKNRKVICRFKWETPAKQKFNALIQQVLLQTKIDFVKNDETIEIKKKEIDSINNIWKRDGSEYRATIIFENKERALNLTKELEFKDHKNGYWYRDEK